MQHLINMGLTPGLINGIRDFWIFNLFNLNRFNPVLSDETIVNTGAHQGSVLLQLPFSVYIYDMHK